MMTLLLSEKHVKDDHRSQYTALLKAVTEAEERSKHRKEKGLEVDVEELTEWRVRLKSRLDYHKQYVSPKVM